MKTLNEIRPGQQVVVKKLHGDGPVKKKLMDMGITRNVNLLVQKVAPLGDPIEIQVRGYALSIRKEDASQIEVVGNEA